MTKPQKINTNLENFSSCLKKVGIVGAGPGGLAIAIALQQQGIEVYIYEI